MATTRTELLEIIRNGENSGVEFKRDAIQNLALAKELVAFSNFEGGMVLLGVEDDRQRARASGLSAVEHGHRAVDLRRPHGDRVARSLAEWYYARAHVDRLPRGAKPTYQGCHARLPLP